MKTRILLVMLLAILFISCNTNDPNGLSSKEKIIDVSGVKMIENTPILDWIKNDCGSIIHFSFVDYPTGTCSQITFERNMDANTIMLNDNIGIRIQDSCAFDDSNNKGIFYMTRRCEVIDRSKEGTSNNPLQIRSQTRNEPFSFQFTSSVVDPITITAPLPTDCTPIPMCYYHSMDIRWNADTYNPTEMMIVTEWNGLNMDGSSMDTTIIHHMETADDGVVTLDDNIFNGMPDGALVNIWLIRENIVTIVYDNTNTTWEGSLENVEHDPTLLTQLLIDHPEYTYEYHHVYGVYGAIAHLPIFLIRDTKEEIEERKHAIYI